jgi:hypothetical protein
MTTIDCAHARDLLMEADLADLKNKATPIGQHVAECASCAALAATLFESYAALDLGIDALATGQRLRTEETSGATRTARSSGTISQRDLRWQRWAMVPLAAAAALVLFLGREDSQPLTQPTFLAQLMFPEQPQVNPPAGKQAVIIEKRDLTVVWLY